MRGGAAEIEHRAPSSGVRGERGPLIIVAGNIGAGKSTLADALARELGLELVPEPFEENPYLEDYYRDPVAWGYRTQRWFIEHELARQPEIAARGGAVQDRAVYEKAEVFVPVMHERGELRLSEALELSRLYERTVAQIPAPDLLVYLAVPPAECARRIAARGRPSERSIDRAYLEALERAYERFASRWRRSPLLRVDGTACDPREPGAARRLAEQARLELAAGRKAARAA